MIVTRYTLDIAGVLSHYENSGPGAKALCIMIDGSTLITLGLNGGIAGVLVITLDRYWKVVYPIHPVCETE